MSSEKLFKCCFFVNDIEGGVSSVISNIINYSTKGLVTNEIITVYENSSTLPKFSRIIKDVCIKRFEYSVFENQYYLFKRLLKLVPDSDTVIISNDGLEMKLVAKNSLKNPLVFILHGNYDYYYDQAIQYEPVIDRFITVTNVMKEKLVSLLPSRIDDILYIPFPVPIPELKVYSKTENENLRILFVGRISNEKGAFDLPLIDQQLKNINCNVDWTIIGSGIEELQSWAIRANNVMLMNAISNEEVLKEYSNHDIIILPSKAEGFPVVIAEGMKAGLVPLVSDLEGIGEIVETGFTGFRFNIGDIEEYVRAIAVLDKDRKLLNKMSNCCSIKSKEKFDPYTCSENYIAVFKDAKEKPLVKGKVKSLKQSRLDRKWIPNILVKKIRMLKIKLQ